MKKARNLFYLLGFTLIFCLRATAQDSALTKTTDSAISNLQDSLRQFEKELDELLGKKKSYFQAEVNFLSNNVFMGRKDSVATPYLTPSFGYYHKSGLYLNALASYLPSSGQSRFDLFTIEAGYAHKTRNFDMQITASKFFYNSSSYNVESEIEANAVAAFDYNFKFITPVLQGMVIFGPNTDFAANFGLEHSFYMMKNSLTITPSVVANASTQNYYNSYYRYRRYALKRFKVPVNYTIIAEVLNASKFKMLDYEISMAVSYTIKKLAFNFAPVYSIPVNPAQLQVTRQIGPIQLPKKIFTEKLHDSFFFQASIAYRF